MPILQKAVLFDIMFSKIAHFIIYCIYFMRRFSFIFANLKSNIYKLSIFICFYFIKYCILHKKIVVFYNRFAENFSLFKKRLDFLQIMVYNTKYAALRVSVSNTTSCFLLY